MISQSHIINICQHYSLGNPLDLKAVPGGLLHRLFYLRTASGEYAIKVLCSKSQQRLSHNLLTPQVSQEIASAMSLQQVPTVVALQRNNEFIFSKDNQVYMVMPWVTGNSIKAVDLATESIMLIGAILARIHQAKIEGKFVVPCWRGLSESAWISLFKPLAKLDKSFSELLLIELPHLLEWSQKANAVLPKLNKQLIFSHRDFDPKNVIWQNPQQPLLLDWEYAGLINPTLDLFIVALNWSDVLSGQIKMENFNAVVSGYLKTSFKVKPLTTTIFKGYVGYCLDWLKFNLSQLPPTPSSKLEVMQTLAALHAVVENQDVLINHFNSSLANYTAHEN